MATRNKESVPGTGVSPMASSTPTERRRRSSLRPSTPPGTTVAKDHGKAPATSSTAEELRKHAPNYLKPTLGSNLDAAKHTAVKKHAHDDTHKPTPTTVRRRSFDRPVPPSQAKKAVQSLSARGERTTPPFSPKHSAAATRPASSSSERISKVVKAVKSQPPLLKTSSSSGAKKDVKTNNLKRATPSMEEEPVHAPNTIESEAEDQESLDLNVEEELAKMESPVDLPPEKHFAKDQEHIDEENHSPKEHADENKEIVNSTDTNVSEYHQDEHERIPEPVAEITENLEVTHEEIHVVHESQHADESDQQSIQAVNEAPAEDGDTKEEEKDNEKEKETVEEIKPVGLTVRTIPDEKDEVADEEEQGQHDAEGRDERQNSKEPVHKIDDEEKPANSEAENAVHKRHVGGPSNKKESPAYNDVIEETASKLIEKRVNKVRALAGAFETVISLQQPDSS